MTYIGVSIIIIASTNLYIIFYLAFIGFLYINKFTYSINNYIISNFTN